MATEPERRLTPTERLHEVTMAAIHREPAPPEHACTIKRNSKGLYEFEITVRGFDAGQVAHECSRLIDNMAELYPYPGANGGTE